MITITKPNLPDYVTAWSWQQVPNAVAGIEDEGTFYRFRFTIANHEMNLGWSVANLAAIEDFYVHAKGRGWQFFWDEMFEKTRAKIVQAPHDGKDDGEADHG
jgi:hypothetical protein